jgi:MoaD family protein
MKVKVSYLGYIRNMLGKQEEEFELEEKTTLGDLLNMLSEKYGEPFKKEVYEPGLQDLKYGYGVIINGILMARLQGLKTPLKEGDRIILTTLISGG